MVKYSCAVAWLITNASSTTSSFFTVYSLEFYFYILGFGLAFQFKKFTWFKAGHISQYNAGKLLNRSIVISYSGVVITARIAKVGLYILQGLLQFKKILIGFKIGVSFCNSKQTSQ